MGKNYTAKVQVNVWKQHCCIGCGLPFAYALKRDVVGAGASEDAAQRSLQRAVQKTLEQDVDTEACPSCGLVQPDMVAAKRSPRHRVLIGCTVAVLIVVVILRLSLVVQSNVLTWIIACLVAAIAAMHFLSEQGNPNGNLSANLKTAQDRQRSGSVHVPEGAAPQRTGPARPEHATPPRSGLYFAGLIGLAVSVVLAVAPELIRMATGGTINDHLYPPVAGPGDETRVYFDQTIQSVKGYWRGSPVVQLTCDGTAYQTAGYTNSNNWGNNISAKSSEKRSTARPWVELQIPDNAELANKRVDCRIDMQVVYPQMSGNSTFDEVTQDLSWSGSFQLSSPGAGSSYRTVWWVATMGALVGLVVSGVLLRKANAALARTAMPTQVLS